MKRSQAPIVDVAAEPGSRGLSWTALALTVVLALGVAVILRRRAPEPAPRPAPQPSAVRAPKIAPVAPPVARWQAPLPTSAREAPPAAAVDATAAPATPSAPTPSADASATESLDDRRQHAAEAFDRTLAQLAAKAQHFRKEAQHYRNGCQSGGGPWPPAGCDAAREDLRRSLQELEDALDASEEEARRSAVYPGVRADIRRRHGLDEEAWAALQRSAKETLE